MNGPGVPSPPAEKHHWVWHVLCAIGFHDWEFSGIDPGWRGSYVVCRHCRLRGFQIWS